MPYANQIQRILESTHHDPFEVLGYHEVDNKTSSIRAFFPNVAGIDVIFLKTNEVFHMDKIRDQGFFHVNFNELKRGAYLFRITNHHGFSWNQSDPYYLKPFVSEFDMHLFSEGNHHRLYELLGAHPFTLEGVKGVRYAVWAPNAKRVSLVGPFNNWDGRCNPIRNRGNCGIWELFMPDHCEGELYKFEIKTHDNQILLKTDPLGFHFEMRPATASIVHDIHKYTWSDSEWMATRHARNNLESPISFYEVHLGSWMRVPEDNNRWMSYRELADKLIPYVKWLGFTHIELLPIAEHPFDGSWGYQVTGNYAPTSRFGSPNDFKYFVDRCHVAGLGVVIDWVPAHFPKDAFSLARFDGSCLYEHSDPKKGEHQDWGTLIYNYGRNEIKNFLVSNALFWYDIFHIDGLRVDAVASMLYLDYSRKAGEWNPNQFGGRENLEAIEFIKQLNTIVYQYFPDTMTIAEESTAFPGVSQPIYNGGLGFGFKWNMGWMHDFLNYISKEPIHRKYHHNELTFSMLYAYHEHFILPISHDEVVHGKCSLLSKMPGDPWQKFANLRVTYAFMFAHPGKKLIFMGSEFGQWDEWNAERSLDWHLSNYPLHRGIQLLLKDLNRLYATDPAFHEVDYSPAGFEWIDCSDYESSIVSFIRWSKDYKSVLVAIFNFTPVLRYDYRLGVPFKGQWTEVFNSDSEIYGGSNAGNYGGRVSEDIPWMGRSFSININLPPLAAVYFKFEKR
ncbi:glycogen branching enzyme [sediment metagenome]|uniref:1,4-alpha-glucan branching enzyme n=1 Tax=sediment metagenome TaxID=749907 RepID=D9PF36_9ZZZZ